MNVFYIFERDRLYIYSYVNNRRREGKQGYKIWKDGGGTHQKKKWELIRYAELYKNTITFQSFEEYPHSNPRSMWKQQHHSLSFNLIDMNDGTWVIA